MEKDSRSLKNSIDKSFTTKSMYNVLSYETLTYFRLNFQFFDINRWVISYNEYTKVFLIKC